MFAFDFDLAKYYALIMEHCDQDLWKCWDRAQPYLPTYRKMGISFVVVAVVCWLGYRILFPTVLPYPWPMPTSDRRKRRDKSKTVVFAGSFNPPHMGHLTMIAYLSERFGKVIITIGVNPNKRYHVSGQQRADLIRKMLADTMAMNVGVTVAEGYIWRKVRPLGASMFVRGIRNWEMDGSEEYNLLVSNTWGPIVLGPLWYPIPTLFLEGKPQYNHISSTLIRETSAATAADKKIALAELEQLVPETIARDVQRLYCNPPSASSTKDKKKQ